MFLSSRTDRTLYGMTNWSRLRVKDLQYREVRLVVEVEKEEAVVMAEAEAVVGEVVAALGVTHFSASCLKSETTTASTQLPSSEAPQSPQPWPARLRGWQYSTPSPRRSLSLSVAVVG